MIYFVVKFLKIKKKLPEKYSQHTEDRVDEFYLGSKKYLVYVNSDFNYIIIGPVNGGITLLKEKVFMMIKMIPLL